VLNASGRRSRCSLVTRFRRRAGETGAGLLFERIDLALEHAPHLMQQCNDFDRTDAQRVQHAQVGLNPLSWHAQHQFQEVHQAGNAYTDATLPEDLPRQVELRAVPALAGGVPVLDDPMLIDHNWLRGRQFDHLAVIVGTTAAQREVEVRAVVKGVESDAGWHITTTLTMVLSGPFPARMLEIVGFGLVGLNDGRWAGSLLFEFSDALGSSRKLLF
jgi:hypothetical protein